MSVNNKKKPLAMKGKSLERVLKMNGLEWANRELPDGYGVQYKLSTPGFEQISINYYPKSEKVVVQPWDCPLAKKLQTSFKLYAELRTYRIEKRRRVKCLFNTSMFPCMFC